MPTRQQLVMINRKTLRYPLPSAEKDYFLALVMQIISQSHLHDRMIFKGGTAIHHCYLEQYRFSEDLDFSTDQGNLSLGEVRNLLAGHDFLAINKASVSATSINIERLQYIGPLLQPSFLKVEIDILQNVLLPPVRMKYHNVWGLNIEARVMDVREICAEKIRAMSERARYRDYYDLALLVDAHNIDMEEVVTYVSKKQIRKPITKANIDRNWVVVSNRKAMEMSQIYYARKIENAQIVSMIDKLPFKEISSQSTAGQ